MGRTREVASSTVDIQGSEEYDGEEEGVAVVVHDLPIYKLIQKAKERREAK